jgi:ATP-dependent Clp protease adaptor protein ClpS
MSGPTSTTSPCVDEQTSTDQPVPWNVVLLDDDDHTYDYVIELAQKLFAMPVERAYKAACTVDTQGRVVLMTTHKELAELKREQVIGYGRDWRMARSKGAMSCIIEPAEGGDDLSGDDDHPEG